MATIGTSRRFSINQQVKWYGVNAIILQINSNGYVIKTEDDHILQVWESDIVSTEND